MSYAEIVMVGALLVAALAALSIETQVRAIRRVLDPATPALPAPGNAPAELPEPESGVCVWAYRGGQWSRELTGCRVGYEPGPPPARPGRFEGDFARTACVPTRRQG